MKNLKKLVLELYSWTEKQQKDLLENESVQEEFHNVSCFVNFTAKIGSILKTKVILVINMTRSIRICMKRNEKRFLVEL